MENLQTLNQNVKYTQRVCVCRSLHCMRPAKFLPQRQAADRIGSAEVK